VGLRLDPREGIASCLVRGARLASAARLRATAMPKALARRFEAGSRATRGGVEDGGALQAA
jgi:hypothetical protein